MIDKRQIVSELISHFKRELELYEKVAAKAREDAINSEVKQEGKYDTRAIEAGYLAGAQKRRQEEIIFEVQKLEALDLDSPFGEKVRSGSLVLLEEKAEQFWCFISPSSGGMNLNIGGESVRIISSVSPIAKALVSLDEGDCEIQLDLPAGRRELLKIRSV
ncbi:hypothetical protein GW915_06825 [bacterium]|nr:hypothetical protein [bacterium]